MGNKTTSNNNLSNKMKDIIRDFKILRPQVISGFRDLLTRINALEESEISAKQSNEILVTKIQTISVQEELG